MGASASRPAWMHWAAAGALSRLATAVEILLVYAGILLYIWRWQFTHPRAWMALLALVLASHVVHRDRLRELGLTSSELGPSATLVLRLAVAIYVPLACYGFLSRTLTLLPLTPRAFSMFVSYGIWCLFQQYLTQSYFHHRLMSIIPNRNLSSLLVALMFGGAHIPNPILMVVTTAGGFILAQVFSRHRNIWPLGLAQAAGGFLVAALSPASLIHNMRVGPGYFFYGLPQ